MKPAIQPRSKPNQKFLAFPKTGFISVLMILFLPALMLTTASLASLVRFIDLKREFRFICIRESLRLQKELQSLPAKDYNRHSRLNSQQLLARLQPVAAQLNSSAQLLRHPAFDRGLNTEPVTDLVIQLHPYFRCGSRMTKEGPQWIYETAPDRF